MAEIDVQPKKTNPWWLWLLIALIALAIVFLLVRGCNSDTEDSHAIDSAAAADTTDVASTLAADHTAFDSVDFSVPVSPSHYDEVSDPDIVVSKSEKYTIYSLGENILFTSGESILQGTAVAKLQQVSASLNRRFPGSVIGVYGSADSVGTARENQMLGARRAEMVKNWMIENGGIAAEKVSVHSLGESQPVRTNKTAAGRKQNRNVQIVAFGPAKIR